MLKTIQGNLVLLAIDGQFDVIVHGCNCFCTMGSGIAKQIKYNFPSAYQADLETESGDRNKLGTCSIAQTDKLTIVNAYTQYNYGRDGHYVDYAALEKCLSWIAATYHDKRIGLPKIGAGLGGGDWNVILETMTKTFEKVDATLVELL